MYVYNNLVQSSAVVKRYAEKLILFDQGHCYGTFLLVLGQIFASKDTKRVRGVHQHP